MKDKLKRELREIGVCEAVIIRLEEDGVTVDYYSHPEGSPVVGLYVHGNPNAFAIIVDGERLIYTSIDGEGAQEVRFN